MKILCETNKEVKVALAQLEKQGYCWNSGHKPTQLYQDAERLLLFLAEDKKKLAMGGNIKDAVNASELYKNLLR